jgi:hypothetical protein
MKTVMDMENLFRAAEDYQETWDLYRDELEEYEKKLEERRKKKPAEAGAEKEREDKGKEPGAKKEADREKAQDEGQKKVRKEEKQGEEKKTPPEKTPGRKDRKKGQKDNWKNGRMRNLAFRDGLTAGAPEPFPFAGEEGKEGGEKGNEQEKDKEAKDKDKKETLKKPERPAFKSDMEWLAKALKGEVAVHLEAHRASDILHALALKDTFHLDLVLVGCTEGYLVADRIREAEVPVILGPVERPAFRERSEYRGHKRDNARILAEKGIPLALAGSGREAGETRFLALQAAAAAGAGLDPDQALAGVTLSAARILGVADRIGSIEKGKDADLLILDGDPLSSRTRVERVLINGITVFERDT